MAFDATPSSINQRRRGIMDKLQSFAVKAQNAGFNVKHAERTERGAAGVEYGLLVALIAAVIILAVTTLGTKVNAAFTFVNAHMP
jgi:pilus assembly protein Flp/PilA